MAKKRQNTFQKTIGLPPGSLVFVGQQKQEQTHCELYVYNEQVLNFVEYMGIEKIPAHLDTQKVNWLNINGLHDITQIQKLGDHFNLHALTLEDILNTEHLPKLEDYDSYLFFTLKMLQLNAEKQIEQEHLSFILTENTLLSLQEKTGDVFRNIRERLKASIGRARKRQADYLFYLLIDAVVDNYYTVLEYLRNRLDNLEERLMLEDEQVTMEQIFILRKQLIAVRKSVQPLREAVGKILKEPTPHIRESSFPFIRDLTDHLTHLSMLIDTFHEQTVGLVALYQSNQANRMNAVMKMLTIVATIFIPITFIAGIYGMNFENMPELSWQYGYPLALGSMLFTALGMLWYMYQKKWL